MAPLPRKRDTDMTEGGIPRLLTAFAIPMALGLLLMKKMTPALERHGIIMGKQLMGQEEDHEKNN